MYANKIVLITGGSSGLGKNLALSYAREKAKIINLSRNSQKMAILNSVLNKLNSQKNKFYSVDVSDYDKILEVKDIILRENNIPDIIINNAAGNFLCPFENLSKNGWSRVIDIVLNGGFNTYHIFGKALIENKKPGVFLNISTTYSQNSSGLVIPSAAAKAGVDNIMKGLSVEWRKHGLRFVGIAPGPIADSGGASKLDPLGIFKHYNNYTNPSQRMCSQREISELAMYLTSSKADYINGEIIKIDGGEWIKNQGEFSFLTNMPFYKKIFSK
jgi:2,4-dienoyl-CoA reductase [(3E)-enoyl-CoA-producing], mitochondrial